MHQATCLPRCTQAVKIKALQPQINVPGTKTVPKHATHAFKPEVYTHPDGTKIRVQKKIPKAMSLRDLQKQGYIKIENMSPTGKLPEGEYKANSGFHLDLKGGIVQPNC